MADVGLGQLVSSTGRLRTRAFKDAVRDNHPLFEAMDENNGIQRKPGGRTIVQEAKTGQNSTVKWVGASGRVNLTDGKVLDASEFDWKYQLAAVTFTLSEQYMNEGGSDIQYANLVGKKLEVAEDSCMNEFHEGMLSNGTAEGGLQLGGLAALVSTTPTTGVVGNIDRSNANAAWFRNQKFDTASDWALGAVDATNIKKFLDKGINATMRNSKTNVQLGIMGDTHFEHLSSALQAIQVIQNEHGTLHAGFQKLIYRGVPMYYGGGVNYSGAAQLAATRTYLLNVKDGGVNLVFHQKAEFDILDPINSEDQAAVSRLIFTMANMTLGGLAKFNWVGFD